MIQTFTKSVLWLAFLTACILTSCSKEPHEGEQGLAVALTMPNDDAINNLHLWIFDSNSVLKNEYSFKSTTAMASELLPLTAGTYTVVTGTNLTAPFSYTTNIGTTKADELLILLDDAKASPVHAHYGVQTVTTVDNGITRTEVKMNRVLAELQFSIHNVPAEVVSVEAEVLNCAKGFYPSTSKLTTETAQVDMGKQTPVNGTVEFPMLRVMPVVEFPKGRATIEEETKTQIRFIFTFTNGTSTTVEVVAPVMQNGGSYTPEVEYETLRKGATVDITGITDWGENAPIEGGILNPTN